MSPLVCDGGRQAGPGPAGSQPLHPRHRAAKPSGGREGRGGFQVQWPSGPVAAVEGTWWIQDKEAQTFPDYSSDLSIPLGGLGDVLGRRSIARDAGLGRRLCTNRAAVRLAFLRKPHLGRLEAAEDRHAFYIESAETRRRDRQTSLSAMTPRSCGGTGGTSRGPSWRAAQAASATTWPCLSLWPVKLRVSGGGRPPCLIAISSCSLRAWSLAPSDAVSMLPMRA